VERKLRGGRHREVFEKRCIAWDGIGGDSYRSQWLVVAGRAWEWLKPAASAKADLGARLPSSGILLKELGDERQ
jgi:hypothetical protein